MERKKGNILVSNVMYIVLVLMFMGVLFLFVSQQSSKGALLEERMAKKIALTIDSADANSQVSIYVGSVMERNEGIENPIGIEGNTVLVKLSQRGGYSYNFFNDVEVGNVEIKETEGGSYLFFVVR